MYYLFLDTETGGLPEHTSLLEIGFVVTDGYFDILEECVWKVKPDDGIYHVTAQALEVNKINLIEHDKEAITYKQVKTPLSTFIHKWWSNNCCKPLIPVGKNVAFDVRRLYNVVISPGHWESMVSYQPLELNGAWRMYEARGKVPHLPKTSLCDIATYLGIEIENSKLHSSLYDCKLTLEIIRKLMQL